MNRSPFRHALATLLGALALIVAIASVAAAQDMLASARARYHVGGIRIGARSR